MDNSSALPSLSDFSAVLFDLDGVLTPTADLHQEAWRSVFTAVLSEKGVEAPYTDKDYFTYLDGKKRDDGVSGMLVSRGIHLPLGTPDDDPTADSVWGVGNRKNEVFTKLLTDEGIKPYPGSRRLVEQLVAERMPMAIVSSSKNARWVLTAAGLIERFPVIVDGVVAADEGLASKPAPDMFEDAARKLGVDPGRAVVFEDAISGVAAAHAGGFALVVGVDRGAGRKALTDAGAHVVVDDPGEFDLRESAGRASIGPADEAGETGETSTLGETGTRFQAGDESRLGGYGLDPGRFPVDPWRLAETTCSADDVGVVETLFAVGNGYLGMRANNAEGRHASEHGTYINGLHETWRIRHAEAAYGFAEVGQTIVNAPDSKVIRLYVDDEPFAVNIAEVMDYERAIDFREGVLRRDLVWLTPGGKRVRITSSRMVSFAERHLALMTFEVTVLDADAALTMSCQLINRQDGQDEYSAGGTGSTGTSTSNSTSNGTDSPETSDPRRAERIGDRVFQPREFWQSENRSVLSYRITNSGMTVALAADHIIETQNDYTTEKSIGPDMAKNVFAVHARQGVPVRITKVVSYHTSRTAPTRELIDRCRRTLGRVATEGVPAQFAKQHEWLDAYWERSDVEIPGHDAVQQAVRWNLYQLAQASARADGLGIPAKGVTGSGYSGHYFWDTEIYLLPFLAYTSPQWARNALRQRENMLPLARKRARTLNEEGALFPWRTINGEEASAYYAAGTAQYHINADVTYALAKFINATGDVGFLTAGAIDIAVETARMWITLGFWRGTEGESFEIHGVTGPDEYTTVVNNNLFTNVMARFNLDYAARAVRDLERDQPEAHARMVKRLDLRADEIDEWLRAASAMAIPFSESLQIHPQDEHFLEREVWDLSNTPADKKPLMMHYHPLVIYRFQVLKQADVVLALFLQGDQFTDDEKRADFDYYDPLTTSDSTLSNVVQSIMAAEIGYRELALDYFLHTLFVDLSNLHDNTSDGVHVASAGGVWNALVSGFGGMRDHGGNLTFDPRLPVSWPELRFRMMWHGTGILVRLTSDRMLVSIREGENPLAFSVRGRAYEIAPGDELSIPLDGQGPDYSGIPLASPYRREDGTLMVPSVPTTTNAIPIVGFDERTVNGETGGIGG